MSNVRDQPMQFGVPVNYETGLPVTDRQRARLEALRDAYELLLSVMHDADGSSQSSNEQFSTRRMSIAATQIELGMMMARRAALESP
jgi:hypothetical protein